MLTCDRNSIESEGFVFSKITDFSVFRGFDCGRDDLNDFIRNDAEPHKVELIAETYAFAVKTDDKLSVPLAFVSLSNDTIKRVDLPKSVIKSIPRQLRYAALPAVKIGRLGVRKLFQSMDVGTAVINLMKQLFTTENRTGCRFMTVDAYNDDRVLNFYLRNGFDFYHERDANEDTRIMFFDLKTFVPPQG